MLKRVKWLLKDKKGSSGQYIAISITILVTVMLILIAFATFDGLQKYSNLNTFADEIVKVAANNGKTKCDEIDSRYKQLSSNTGLTPTLEWSAKYFDTQTGKVQYGDSINLTAKATIEISVFGELKTPIELTIKKSTQSMQYWK